MSMHDDLVARAIALKPVLAERAPYAEVLRRLPDETVKDFQDAGFWKMLQPKRFGGLEVHPNTFFEVQMTVASACPSTAWVLGVVAVHSWQLALFSDEAQQEVWADDPQALISSSYAPTGTVERVEGGFKVSGRWSFSSGCDHCDWAFLGGFVPVEAGPPDMRTFLVPKADYVIEDTWHTIALKGTGSKDIVLDGVFVPEHRTHKMSDGFRCSSPGNEFNTAPLYRIPFGQIFVRSVSTASIGMARGALEFYREVTRTRIGAADGSKAVENPLAMETCARAASTIDQLELVLRRNFDEMMEAAERGERVDLERRVAWRWNSSEVVSRCVDIIDDMFTACGGRAIFLSSPMHRFFIDVHGARAHYANRTDSSSQNYGRVLLGGKTRDFFL
jgi:3-hydroxy-9,10-secoandrosta-1,3,5(10)-triene-9,17-dione monooxygenase